MNELAFLIVILSIVISCVSVVRWKEAERRLEALSPRDCDFEINRMQFPNGKVACTVAIYKRKGIPVVSDLTGKSVSELADMFDDAEKNGKKCIFETAEF